MPIDKKGSGGGGGGTKILPAQMPDLYDPNKTIRLLIECNNQTGGSPAPPGTMILTTSATATAIAMDGDRPCVFEFASSATANSVYELLTVAMVAAAVDRLVAFMHGP